jgi:phosphatidylinositol-3-phosphatase
MTRTLLVIFIASALLAPAAFLSTVSASPAAPCATTTQSISWEHVVWIVMENKDYQKIVGSPSAPYTNSLMASCGLATNYKGIGHPSLPNYLAMTSGSTQGVTNDKPPADHKLTASSIFSQLGTDWTSLMESMPSNCFLTDSGSLYSAHHNPAAYFTNIRTQCQNQDVPLGSTPDISAAFTFITANQCNNMHDCSIATGDKWLSTFIPKLVGSATYASGRTAVFLTWDEGSTKGTNRVATVVIAPSVPRGSRSGTAYTHYSLLKTTQQMLGLPQLGNAASASSMASGFHL